MPDLSPDELLELAAGEPNDRRRRDLVLAAMLISTAALCRAGSSLEDTPRRARVDLAVVASDLDDLAADFVNDHDPRGPWS